MESLDSLTKCMLSKGVVRLYAKLLAPNDNSKNQVYIGGDFACLNMIPNLGFNVEQVKSSSLKSSKTPEEQSVPKFILKAGMSLSWLRDDNSLCPAPHSQMILYPQYPEVRMSGFLKGCVNPPSDIMASRDAGRILFLGVTDADHVIGFAITADNPIANELRSRKLDQSGVFMVVPVTPVNGRDLLLQELRRIHTLDWINSKRLLADGSTGECSAPHCGGYTLEAELGITPNGNSEPDFNGWEVKQYSVSNFGKLMSAVLTLMTPEPTGGHYRSEGVDSFIRTFGYPDRHGRENRMNFGGIHRAGEKHGVTGLTLTLRGFDAARTKITDPNGGICLVSDSGEDAAVWNFTGLINHWKRKHSQAVYIPSQKRVTPQLQYRYGSVARLGEGTDFSLFLKAMAARKIYYDPGIKLEGIGGKETVKRRSQFRIKSADLSDLYETMSNEILSGE